MRILLLEDEAEAADRVVAALQADAGAALTVVSNVDVALAAATRQPFDILILDRMVGDEDGLAVLRRLRDAEIATPAIVLSNLSTTRNRVEGLDAGADDYLAKPFEPDELVARVRALHRRLQPGGHASVLLVDGLEVRRKARTAFWRERHLELAPKEFDILQYLTENHDIVVSRQMLWDACWPEYRIPPQTNVIDVSLSRLRAKIAAIAGRPVIETVRGQGFLLRSQP